MGHHIGRSGWAGRHRTRSLATVNLCQKTVILTTRSLNLRQRPRPLLQQHQFPFDPGYQILRVEKALRRRKLCRAKRRLRGTNGSSRSTNSESARRKADNDESQVVVAE